MNAIAGLSSEAGLAGLAEQKAKGLARSVDQQEKNSKDIGKIKKLAEDFEAVFMETMLGAMRKSVQKSGLIDGGNAEDIYRSMLDTEYSKMMANQRSSGIATAIERYLTTAAGLDKKPAVPESSGNQGLQATGKQARIQTSR